ncbi:MAG: dTDP-4-dehydrorhamnose reductase [Pseudomonadota bacterium]
MKLLCIGQSGQVALALAERAAANAVECVCVGRPKADLSAPESLARAIDATKPDLVINAGAYTAVDAAETDRDAAFLINADGAGSLAAGCAQMSVPLIHLSTDYVFDGRAERAYRETDSPAPLNVYGASKLAGEVAVREALNEHIILRTSWVVSPFGTNFIKTMLRLATDRDEASVVDDQIGSPTSASDIADTIVHIASMIISDPNAVRFGTYHLSGQGYGSWADVAELVFRIAENRCNSKIVLKRIPTSEYPTPAKRPLNSRLDTTKIEQTFNVKPPDWAASVTRAVNRLIDEGY